MWMDGESSSEDDDVCLGEADSNSKKEGDRTRRTGGHCQFGLQKVAARLHRQGAPWKGNVSRERRYDFSHKISSAVCEDRGW